DSALDRLVLDRADRLLLVLRPDEQGIERARRVLDDGGNRRYLQRIGLVLNQVGLHGTDEAIGAIEYRLGAPVVASLPFDAQRLAAAANDRLLTDPAGTRQWLEDQVLGFGELGPLMRTPSIQTIRIMGPHRLYVVENGHQHRLAGVRFRDDQAVRDLVKRFAA